MWSEVTLLAGERTQFAPGQMTDHPLNIRRYYRLKKMGYAYCSGLIGSPEGLKHYGYNCGGTSWCPDGESQSVIQMSPFRVYRGYTDPKNGMRDRHVGGDCYGMQWRKDGKYSWDDTRADAYMAVRGYGCFPMICIDELGKINRKRARHGLPPMPDGWRGMRARTQRKHGKL